MHDNSDAAIAAAHTIIALEPVALPIETVPQATGLARTRQAVYFLQLRRNWLSDLGLLNYVLRPEFTYEAVE